MKDMIVPFDRAKPGQQREAEQMARIKARAECVVLTHWIDGSGTTLTELEHSSAMPVTTSDHRNRIMDAALDGWMDAGEILSRDRDDGWQQLPVFVMGVRRGGWSSSLRFDHIKDMHPAPLHHRIASIYWLIRVIWAGTRVARKAMWDILLGRDPAARRRNVTTTEEAPAEGGTVFTFPGAPDGPR